MSGREERAKRFTKSELKKFDGKQGRLAYVTFKGKVFDVSNSGLWGDGTHMDRHSAGDDLTESILNAPHGEEVFMKFPVVGELSEEGDARHRLPQRIERLHLHPIIVHFSIAYPIVVSLLSLLYFLTNVVCFELASYYLLVLGLLSGPFCGFSGVFSWKIKYEGRMTRAFSRKIIFTVALIVIMTICITWRTLQSDVLLWRNNLSYVYFALVVSLVPISIILGYYGGKIVYS